MKRSKHIAEMMKAERRFHAERDRRYCELADARDHALKIAETADAKALDLARQIQTYKDEQANELREQINAERGLYSSKDEVKAEVEKIETLLKPLLEYVTGQQGRVSGISSGWGLVVGIVSFLAVICGVVFGVVSLARR